MDKALLLAPRLPEGTVDIPGIGQVRVRALNRAEAMAVQGRKGSEATERLVITLGLLDPADMTEAEVGQWMKAATAGELEPVANKIAELSGLLEGSAKAAYKSDGGGSDAGVRDVPGEGATDDGGPAPDGDE